MSPKKVLVSTWAWSASPRAGSSKTKIISARQTTPNTDVKRTPHCQAPNHKETLEPRTNPRPLKKKEIHITIICFLC